MTESPSQQGRRSGINCSYWTPKSMGNVDSLNLVISESEMLYCSALILCNRLLSSGLSFVIKAASLASDFTHIPKDLVLWLTAKIPDAFYSWGVILPYSLVPVWRCNWDETWPHLLCREQHSADTLEPSAELLTWGATFSTLPAAVERGPTAWHHCPEQHILCEYHGSFCFTTCLLCQSYLLSHAASHSTL